MKKSTLGVVIAFIAVALIAGLVVASQNKDGGSSTSSDNSMDMSSSGGEGETTKSEGMQDLTAQSEVTMDISDFKFTKPEIKIKKGTKVTWTNQDSAKHNTILDDTANGAPSSDEVKDDVFAGPLLAKGESYSFTFNEVSDNSYHCSPHPYMKGTVSVVE